MKKTILFIAALFFISSSIMAEDLSAKDSAKNGISSAIESILEDFGDILPENSSLLNAQPDAYIGKLFPSIPPHFTAGLSATGTVINTSILTDQVQNIIDSMQANLTSEDKGSKFVDELNMDNLDLPKKIPLPSAAVQARLGGIILPVDLGLFAVSTFNFLDDVVKKDDIDVGIKYTTFGFDARYSAYEGSFLLPKISVGGGYAYSKLHADLGMETTIDTNEIIFVKDGDNTINGRVSGNLSNDVDMNVQNHTIFAQVQASKKILIFTPYVGFKAMLTKSVIDYDWAYNTAIDRSSLPDDEEHKNDIEKKAVDLEKKYSDSDSRSYTNDFDFNNLSTQIFGGLGLDIAFFQMAFNVAYNFKTQYFTGGLGINLKI